MPSPESGPVLFELFNSSSVGCFPEHWLVAGQYCLSYFLLGLLGDGKGVNLDM